MISPSAQSRNVNWWIQRVWSRPWLHQPGGFLVSICLSKAMASWISSEPTRSSTVTNHRRGQYVFLLNRPFSLLGSQGVFPPAQNMSLQIVTNHWSHSTQGPIRSFTLLLLLGPGWQNFNCFPFPDFLLFLIWMVLNYSLLKLSFGIILGLQKFAKIVWRVLIYPLLSFL